MELGEIVSPAAVATDISASDKKDLLRQIAARSAPLIGLEEQTLYEALMQRERLGTTGLGSGIAVPHARIAGLKTIAGYFVQLTKPVDFQSIDGAPVDLIFALFAPADAGADHLNALVQVSRALRDEKTVMRLRAAREPKLLHALLTMPPQQRAA